METNVLVDGEWVTRTVDLEDVLRHHDQQDRNGHTISEIETAPAVGILTHTVIRSPIINHILPIKMRGLEHNDVAFIGADFVQVKELRADGFLWEFARKENFGATIRNARVIGCIDDLEQEVSLHHYDVEFTGTDNDAEKLIDLEPEEPWSSQIEVIPAQFLVLQLDTGDSVFLTLQQARNGNLHLVICSRHRVSEMMLNTQPGMHLCVDPTSQYMAIAGSESYFEVLELRSREELMDRAAKGLSIDHVKSSGFVAFHGVVHKMEFLYPSSDMVVLLVLVVLRGKTRMVIYEWTPGFDISRIEPFNPRGHLLPREHQMPLLLIPLKFKSTFILVSETCMAVFQDVLEGAPNKTSFYNRSDPPTELHHGLGSPLWVSWARPTNRTTHHNDHHDDIYIAREDGLLKFLMIDCDDFVESDMNVGEFEGRCGTALACIDYRNPQRVTGDLLITGGESCAGGSYLVTARETPLLIQSIDNWAPSQDFVAIPDPQSSRYSHPMNSKSNTAELVVPRPDRIFVCSGMGVKGAISELRQGLEARVGLYFDYETPIMRAWALPFDELTSTDSGDTLFLLSMGSSSRALRLSSDESSVEPVDHDLVQLEFEHQTLAVCSHNGIITQVTEKSVVVISNSRRIMIGPDQLLHVQEGMQTIGLGSHLHQAMIIGSLILYTTMIGDITYLLGLDVEIRGNNYEINQEGTQLYKFSTHVTCLAACQLRGIILAIAAEWDEDAECPILNFTPVIPSPRSTSVNLSDLVAHKGIKLTKIESLATFSCSAGLLVLCGTRNGILLIVRIAAGELREPDCEYYVLGAGSVTIQKDKISDSESIFLAHCDTRIFALTSTSASDDGDFERVHLHQIWVTDAANRSLPQPSVTSILGHFLNYGTDRYDRMAVVAGSQLYLTSLDMSAKAVPRHTAIGGTPTRLIYSRHLNALVVGVNIDGASNILFLDPDTGENLSLPVDGKTGNRVEFASGLGRPGERFFRLLEWPYVKGARTWNFIIAATNEGRLLILSAESRREVEIADVDGMALTRPRIQFHTRYKFKCPGPIYSVAGFPGGLLLCSDKKLICYTLDESDRKFKEVAEYELESFARKLEYSEGTIYALTQDHSLVVLSLEMNDSDGYTISRKSSDALTRPTMDHIIVANPCQGIDVKPIHIISDRHQSLTGLWPIEDAIVNTLEPVFEAQLSSSVIKFQSTSCRPIWDPSWLPERTRTNKNTAPNAIEPRELLGLTVDGAVHKLTLLSAPAWEFLRFIVNNCKRSRIVCEFNYQSNIHLTEVSRDPKILMHVDGDILKRCLKGRRLEEILVGLDDTESLQLHTKFKAVLSHLHVGLFNEDTPPGEYLVQAYRDLKLYLRDVF